MVPVVQREDEIVGSQLTWSQRELQARHWRQAHRRRILIGTVLAVIVLLALLVVAAVVVRHLRASSTPVARLTPIAPSNRGYSWSILHPSGHAPSPRSRSAAVWTGKELLIIGGAGPGSQQYL